MLGNYYSLTNTLKTEHIQKYLGLNGRKNVYYKPYMGTKVKQLRQVNVLLNSMT